MRLVSVFIPRNEIFYWFVLFDFLNGCYLAESGLA